MKLSDLPIHILDDDQPTTCPMCGSRPEFEELEDGTQHHQCTTPYCKYEFMGEFDEEGESYA